MGDYNKTLEVLQKNVRDNGLQRFYPDQKLQQIAQKATGQIGRVCREWSMDPIFAIDIVQLALYDVIVYVDDSGSMMTKSPAENRLEDLHMILSRIAFASTLFDEDGIDVYFMNGFSKQGNQRHTALRGIRSPDQVRQAIDSHAFTSTTPFATQLKRQIIDPVLLPQLRSRGLQKPVLLYCITDGKPLGEADGIDLKSVILQTKDAAKREYGPGVVAFEFAQVGIDPGATETLANLDNDRQVGAMVDCTSSTWI